MRTGKQIKAFAIVLGLVGFAVYSASAGTIYQSGGAGTTYTDALGDQQGSANLLRDISSAIISNDANNLYITLNINPAGNIATGGAFNYVVGITTGSPTAGGDTSAAGDHGNAYGRAISFDSSFGGMTDFIGIFGAGGSGSVASPYTSYGFNDFAFGTPGAVGITNGGWTKMNTVTNGQPIGIQPSTSISNSVTITVPMSDFASNLSLTPGTTIDFDIDSTGTSGNQTAYDSLVDQTPIQPGVAGGSGAAPYSATYQFNETVLDQYTITAVPEPSTIALLMTGLLGALALRRRKA
jgi:PEP-CTERM motif